jgi:hypothetical protein
MKIVLGYGKRMCFVGKETKAKAKLRISMDEDND